MSVAVALIIGTAELLGLLADKADLHGAFRDWISGLDLNTVGFVIVGLFFATWAAALAVWKLARIEEKWTAGLRPVEQNPSQPAPRKRGAGTQKSTGTRGMARASRLPGGGSALRHRRRRPRRTRGAAAGTTGRHQGDRC